jgi:hypothetical protein
MSTLSAPSLDRRRHGTASGRHAAASSYQSSYQRNLRRIGGGTHTSCLAVPGGATAGPVGVVEMRRVAVVIVLVLTGTLLLAASPSAGAATVAQPARPCGPTATATGPPTWSSAPRSTTSAPGSMPAR